jgi:hypothetical protein
MCLTFHAGNTALEWDSVAQQLWANWCMDLKKPIPHLSITKTTRTPLPDSVLLYSCKSSRLWRRVHSQHLPKAPNAFIFMVMTSLLGCTIMMINALRSSETSVTIYQSRRSNNRENLNRQQRGCVDNTSHRQVCVDNTSHMQVCLLNSVTWHGPLQWTTLEYVPVFSHFVIHWITYSTGIEGDGEQGARRTIFWHLRKEAEMDKQAVKVAIPKADY